MAAPAKTRAKPRRAIEPRRLLRALVVLELIALLLLGSLMIARFRVWADVDERPHYDYVQKVVEEHRLPRPTDLVSPEVQAITDRTWPEPSRTDRAAIGLPGRSYEAIQPPLYYVVAAPAFALASDHRDKVYVLRAFDFCLLLLAVWLLWRLARRVAGPDTALAGLAVALLVLLWPGVLVRAITVGNTPLELLLTTAFLLVLWRADAERRGDLMLAASALLGLCLLTKLALAFLVPLFLLVLARRIAHRPGARRVAATTGLAALPALMLSPWLLVNLDRYGSLTVGISGEPGITAPLTSSAALDRLGQLADLEPRLLDGVLPQEWILQLGVWWVRGVVDALALLLLAAGVVALVRSRREWRAWFLALPLISGIVLMDLVFLLTGHDGIYLRYVYAGLVPFALGAGIALAGERVGRMHVAAVTIAGLMLAALWVDMLGAFIFNDLGRTLGIV